jgi:uncharacterized protein
MAAWATAAPDDDTHLGDTLALAEAAQALYRSTAQRRYLALATEPGEVIVRDHRDPAGGFMVRRPDPGAKGVLRYLISLAEDGLVVPGVLLADRELGREPAHVTIVGGKDDPAARALYDVARTYPRRYLRIEWLDRRERGFPASDIEYPEMPEAAAFACANGACSVPVFTPAEVHRIVAKVDDR